MPVGAGQVAPGAQDFQAVAQKPLVTVDHLAQRAHLPGDLVHRQFGVIGVVRIHRVHRAARKNHKGMMVGAVTRERTHGGAVFVTLALGQARSEVQFVGNLKPEQSVVELQRCRRIGNVDAEVS